MGQLSSGSLLRLAGVRVFVGTVRREAKDAGAHDAGSILPSLFFQARRDPLVPLHSLKLASRDAYAALWRGGARERLTELLGRSGGAARRVPGGGEFARQTLLLGHARLGEAGEQVEDDRGQEQRGDGREAEAADDDPAERRGGPRRRRRAVSSSGRPPSTVAIMVITTGRRRMSAALRIASRTDWPWSRSWLANSTIRMPFLAIRPTSMTRPIWL